MSRIDRHSRLVGWLKVALPLAALILLSTLFLLADRIDPSAAIRYAEVDVEDLARDPRMTAPTYAGTTSDGTAITMTASAARPATAIRTAGASDVTMRLDMPDGGSSEIHAKDAEIDTGKDQIRMAGGVEITTSSGYRMVTERLNAALNRSGAASEGAVTATGPQVTIDADRFTLGQTTEDQAAEDQAAQDQAAGGQDETGQNADGRTPADPRADETISPDPAHKSTRPYLLVFSGSVKLIYRPDGASRETTETP